MTAEWRYLVMLNYEVPPHVLQPRVPAGTELDLWDGRALMSVVGFRFLRTRLLGVPIPFHRDFDEVNLRFYVRRTTVDGEVRRGVVFVRELVPRVAIAIIARAVYNEPYRAVPMHSLAPTGPTDAPGRVAYMWRDAARDQRVAATTMAAPALPADGEEGAFVTEHYWGYTRRRDGGTVEYEVTHPPWRIWQATTPELDVDAAKLYGDDFVQPLATAPRSAFIAEGSAVTVFRPRRIA